MLRCIASYRLLLIALSVCFLPVAVCGAGEAISLHGWVSGCDTKGEPLGPIAEAKIELLDESGTVVATAESDEDGYYSVEEAAPGVVTYRVTASGYRAEDEGRGIELPAEACRTAFDFVLSQDSPEAAGAEENAGAGALQVRVIELTDDGMRNIVDAVVAVQNPTAGTYSMIKAGAKNDYRSSLRPGFWRLAAKAPGYPLLVHKPAVTITAGKTTNLTLIVEQETTALAKPKYVEALVAVQNTSAMGQPEVTFASLADDKSYTATLQPVAADDQAFTGGEQGAPGLAPKVQGWKWFIASPSEPLAEGQYRAEASLESFTSDTATRNVLASGHTYFDLTLRSKETPRNDEPTEAPTTGTTTPQLTASSKLHGHIFGQDESGEPLGPVAGSHIELLDDNGQVVAAAISDEDGYYAAPHVPAGALTYRVSASGYATDEGRGLELLRPGMTAALDIALTKRVSSAPQGRLAVEVEEKTSNGAKQLPGAVVRLWRGHEKKVLSVRSPASGKYETTLLPGKWYASASAPGFPGMAPVAVTIADQGLTRTSFTLDRDAQPADVSAMVAVLRKKGKRATPEVSFIQVNGAPGAEVAGKLELLSGNDLAAATGSAESHWDWYIAQPVNALSPGEYFVEGKLSGVPTVTTAPEVASGNQATVFELSFRPVDELGRLVGSVSDISKKPLPGAKVSLRSEVSGQQQELVADKEGKFTTQLSPGVWWAMAAADDFVSSLPVRIEMNAGQETTRNFSLRKLPAETPELKKPRVHALVAILQTEDADPGLPEFSFYHDGKKLRAVSRLLKESEVAKLNAPEQAGEGAIWKWYLATPTGDLTAGRYTASGSLPGYVDAISESRTAAAGKTTYLNLIMRPAASTQTSKLVGNVLNEQGKPLAGSSLRFWRDDQNGRKNLRAGETGGYEVELEAGVWWAVACDINRNGEAPGYACSTPVRLEIAEGVQRHHFVLKELPKPTSVNALVAVNTFGVVEELPAVEFVSSGSRTPGLVRRIQTGEKTNEAVSDGWQWFEAVPATPLEPGDYICEAALSGFRKSTSSPQAAVAGQATTFQLTLEPLVDPANQLVEVRGSIFVQDEAGKRKLYTGAKPGDVFGFIPEEGDVIAADQPRGYPPVEQLQIENGKYRLRTKPGYKLVVVPRTQQLVSAPALVIQPGRPANHDIVMRENASGSPALCVAIRLEGPHVAEVTPQVTFKLEKPGAGPLTPEVTPMLQSVEAVSSDGSRWFITSAQPLPGGAMVTLTVSAKGYGDEVTRRFPVHRDNVTGVMPVYMRPGWKKPEPGVLAGHTVDADNPNPGGLIDNVKFVLRHRKSGERQVVRSGDVLPDGEQYEGTYEVKLRPGKWDVVAAEGYGVVDGESLPPVIPGKKLYHTLVKLKPLPAKSSKLVEAVVAVRTGAGRETMAPAVRFMTAQDPTPQQPRIHYVAAVRPATVPEVQQRGVAVGQESADWKYFIATPQKPLPEGAYAATASAAGCELTSGEVTRTVLADAMTRFNLRLEPAPSRLELAIVNSGYELQPGAEFQIINNDVESAASIKGRVGDDGRSVVDLPPGNYTIAAFIRQSGFEGSVRHIQQEGVTSQRTVEIFAEDEPHSYRVTVEAKDAYSGKAVQGATVYIERIHPPENIPRVTTNAEGLAERLRTVDGEYRVRVDAPGYRRLASQPLIVAGEEIGYEALLVPAREDFEHLLERLLTECWRNDAEARQLTRSLYEQALKAVFVAGESTLVDDNVRAQQMQMEADRRGEVLYCAALASCKQEQYATALKLLSSATPDFEARFPLDAAFLKLWCQMQTEQYGAALRELPELSCYPELASFAGKCCGHMKAAGAEKVPQNAVAECIKTMLSRLTPPCRVAFLQSLKEYENANSGAAQKLKENREELSALNATAKAVIDNVIVKIAAQQKEVQQLEQEVKRGEGLIREQQQQLAMINQLLANNRGDREQLIAAQKQTQGILLKNQLTVRKGKELIKTAQSKMSVLVRNKKVRTREFVLEMEKLNQAYANMEAAQGKLSIQLEWMRREQLAQLGRGLENLEREIAEWVMQAGGKITLWRNPETKISTARDLPEGKVRIMGVDFRGNKRLSHDKIGYLCQLPLLMLELKDTNTTDNDVKLLQRNARLIYMLSLEGTGISDAGVAHLNALENLNALNVANTAITDNAVETLLQLKKLRTIYVHGTQISPAGLSRLRQGLPEANIISQRN